MKDPYVELTLENKPIDDVKFLTPDDESDKNHKITSGWDSNLPDEIGPEWFIRKERISSMSLELFPTCAHAIFALCILRTNMIRFTTFFALVVGGMEVIQPAAAAVLAGRSPRINLGLMNTFQRRQGNAPSSPTQCESICDPVQKIITSLGVSGCSASTCCTDSFETSLYDCLTCADNAVDDDDFTQAQMVLDDLYNACALNGTKLPDLTFPGQNPNRTLSSVVSSTSTASRVTSLPVQSITQSTFGSSTTTATTPTQSTFTSVVTSTVTPTSSPVSSVGIRSVENSFFNLIIVTMMLKTWLYFAAY